MLLFIYWLLLDGCDPGDLRLEQAAADALSAPLLFVLVGVSVGLEEPLRWRGVHTHAGKTVREAFTQTGGETDRSDRHRPGLGLGEG